MEWPGSVVVILLLLVSLFRFTFAFPLALNNGVVPVQGSVRGVARSCTCNAVEFWLRSIIGSPSELALPTFEELTPNLEANHRNYGGRHLRLRPQKNCKLLLKKGEGSSELAASVKSRNMYDGSIEVWLAKNASDCLSLWMKCERESICVGVHVDTSTDSLLSTKRKLLMIADGDQEEKNGFQSYGLLFTAFVLCAMVILVALCGSGPRKSEVCCPEHEDVKVLSSTKITTLRPNDPLVSGGVTKPENQDETAKKAAAWQVVVADQNSNKTSKSSLKPAPFEDVDLSTDGNANASKSAGDAPDGQVSGKRAAKEDKEEKKNGESKGKDKQMGSKRSPAAPESDSNLQAKASRGFSSKLRISLKNHSSRENDKKPKKNKSKKKSGTENLSPSVSPTTLSPPGFQSDGRDRRSFADRELPQRPPDDAARVLNKTGENSYAEPFGAKLRTSKTSEDDEDDENYEQVIGNKTGVAPVSANVEIRKGSSGTAGAAEQRKSKSNPDELYDSVDEKKVVGNGAASEASLDTYETVGGAMKREGSLAEDFYEVVDKRNTLDIYEEPNVLGRKRSFSDISGNAAPSTASETKCKSLERGMRLASGAPPDPPPLEDLQNVARLRHASHDDDQALIDPYTVTKLEGDYLRQETSTKDIILPTAKQAAPMSPEELEEMYAKVDKEKQKRDRLESQAEKDKEEEEEGVEVATTETNTVDKPSSDDRDDESEHAYEAVFDKKDEEEHRGEVAMV